jgi:hypothetical protein
MRTKTPIVLTPEQESLLKSDEYLGSILRRYSSDSGDSFGYPGAPESKDLRQALYDIDIDVIRKRRFYRPFEPWITDQLRTSIRNVAPAPHVIDDDDIESLRLYNQRCIREFVQNVLQIKTKSIDLLEPEDRIKVINVVHDEYVKSNANHQKLKSLLPEIEAAVMGFFAVGEDFVKDEWYTPSADAAPDIAKEAVNVFRHSLEMLDPTITFA